MTGSVATHGWVLKGTGADESYYSDSLCTVIDAAKLPKD